MPVTLVVEAGIGVATAGKKRSNAPPPYAAPA